MYLQDCGINNIITLILICCHFTIIVSQSDCGKIEQCVTDPQRNVWCSLLSNDSISDLVFIITKNISKAVIEDGDEYVQIHWNTEDVRLEIYICMQ